MLIYGLKPPQGRAAVFETERERRLRGVRRTDGDPLAARPGLSKGPRRGGRGRMLSLRILHHDVLARP